MRTIEIPESMVRQIIADLPTGSALALRLNVLLQTVADPTKPGPSPIVALRNIEERKQLRADLVKTALPSVIERSTPGKGNLVTHEQIAEASVGIADAIIVRMEGGTR